MGWQVFLTVFVWISWCKSRLWLEAQEERVKEEDEELWDLVVNPN